MEEQLKQKTEESIKKILDEGITTTNLEHLYKLSKINHIAKEDENMNYSNYGNYGNEYGRGGYGNYGNDYGRRYEPYGRRGVDMKYRGHDYMDSMYEHYGRYEEGREQYNRGNYGAKEDTLRSLDYMMKSAVDFIRMLKEEANSQEEMEIIKKYIEQISKM